MGEGEGGVGGGGEMKKKKDKGWKFQTRLKNCVLVCFGSLVYWEHTICGQIV